MADAGHYAPNYQLDIERILLQAQHRWLKTPEICKILSNYKLFTIASEPPNMPPDGSYFLFDRTKLRHYRNDGHNWTVRGSHVKLKVAGKHVLHCYYARGQEDENFRRRCYWATERELSHIVFVHYRKEMCCSRRQNEVSMRDDPQEDHLNAIDRPNSDGSPAEEGLEEPNNLNQYITELPDLEESNRQHTYPDFWGTVDGENVDNATIPSQMHPSSCELDPSISRDQHFTIIGFAPNRASENSRIKVLIWGRFLISQHEAEQREWSCMFGEVEVPAVIIGNGVLSCHTPPHKSGRVPFYVTCSNRLACSELREFDFLVNDTPEVNNAAEQRDNMFDTSNIQFGELRSSPEYVEDLQLQNVVRDKLLKLLVQKITGDGERPNVLDEVGRDVLCSAATFGYDWALRYAVVAGVDLNLRDVNGLAALHLAAYWGRASTVATLTSLGAAPGELTDPKPEDPCGRRTPAGLASLNGHQGIAGYLAYLSSLVSKS